MRFVVVKFALALTLLFALCVGLIRAQRYNDTALRGFLFHKSCPSVCWQGIRPGVTTRARALQMLEASDWVDEIQISENVVGADVDVIRWTWNDFRSHYVSERIDGRIWSENGMIRAVQFDTNIAFGELWITFGQPKSGYLIRDSRFPLSSHQAIYHELGLRATNSLSCPFNAAGFWDASVTIAMTTPFESDEAAYTLPGWLKDSVCKQ